MSDDGTSRSPARPASGARAKATPATRQIAPAVHVGYDVRAGAAAYAPIVGAIGGFVVPAVVLVFDIASRHHLVHGSRTESLLAAATALLVLALISCLLGAFALAAIGAERSTTPSLIAAVLHAGAGVAVGVVAMLSAFETLAALFFREGEQPFAAITVGAALAGTVLVALVLGDGWSAAPPGHWLSRRDVCTRWAIGAALAGCAPIVLAALAHFSDLGIRARGATLSALVVSGICIAMVSGLGSMFRTVRGEDGGEHPLGQREVVATMAVLSAFLSALLLAMPR